MGVGLTYKHFLNACPHSYKNASRTQKVNVTDSTAESAIENVVLFTGYNKSDIGQLGEEAINCAVLDTACTSTVCGTRWPQCFLDRLSEKELKSVMKKEGEKLFKFGGGETLKSVMSCQLPCRLADTDVLIEVDVVESAIPLLLSLKSLKTAKAKLNLERDTVVLFGKEVSLNFTSSGHYCIPIGKKEGVEVEEVYQIKLSELSSEERGTAILTLHRQFAHPPMIRLKALVQDAGVWKDEYTKKNWIA